MKTCTKCGVEQPSVEFYRNRNECKTCSKARIRAHQVENSEQRKVVSLRSWRKNYATPKGRAAARKAEQKYFSDPENRKWKSFTRRLNKFKITLDEFHAMYERQEGVCACCGNVPRPPKARRHVQSDGFVIDHDHVTGKVRALLCSPCNVALGSFRDNPKVLRQAALYLDHHNAKRPAA